MDLVLEISVCLLAASVGGLVGVMIFACVVSFLEWRDAVRGGHKP